MSKKLFLIYSLKLLFCLSTKCYSFQFYWQISLSKLHVRLHWKPFVPNLCNIGQEVSVSTFGYKLPKSQTYFKARIWGTRNLSSSIHPFSSFHIQGKGKVGNIPYIIREVVSPFQANKKLKFTKKTHIGSWEEKISIHARHDSSCPARSSTQTSVCKHAHVGKEAPWCSADNIQQHKLSLSQMVI